MKQRVVQIDILKGLAIVAVVALHSVPGSVLQITGAAFHIWQAVPVFMILLGFNSGTSAARRGEVVSVLVQWRRRLMRIIPSLAIVFMVSFALMSVAERWGTKQPYIGWLSLLGMFPTPGPGNYFVTILLQFLLLEPLLIALFRRGILVGVVSCFTLDLAFQLMAPYLDVLNSQPYLCSACLLRYLGALGLGYWLASSTGDARTAGWTGKPLQLAFLGGGAAVSITLLVGFVGWQYQVPFFLPQWQFQNLLCSFYPLIIVMLGIRFLPVEEKGLIWSLLGKLGRASLHIFLVQILFFACGASLLPGNIAKEINIRTVGTVGLAAIGNVVLCALLGLGFFVLENRLRRLKSSADFVVTPPPTT